MGESPSPYWDEVYAFKGSCFTFILRKDGIRDGYRLCGDAYIQGVLGLGIYEEATATPEKIKITVLIGL